MNLDPRKLRDDERVFYDFAQRPPTGQDFAAHVILELLMRVQEARGDGKPGPIAKPIR